MNDKQILAHDQEILIREFWKTIELTHSIGKSRERRNVCFRHSFFVAARELTSLSLSAIGKILGKDHATVLHAVRNHKPNYTYDSLYRNIFDDVYSSMAGIVEEQAESLHKLIEDRLQHVDIEGFNNEMINMYRRKLETQQEAFDLQIEALKKQNSILHRNLQAAQKRAEFLNKEALRYKNLV
jgi:hypothetical protein